MMTKRQRFIIDLTEYDLCEDAERFGMAPLAIGFLQYGQRFEVSTQYKALVAQLLPYCAPQNRVAALPQAMDCPLCREKVVVEIAGESVQLGSAEIRVIGEQAIYAAPDLLPHYVDKHGYKPPDEFIEALQQGSGVNSAEFRALHNALT